MVTAAGSGYSQWGGLAVNRWREDPTRDNFGTYFFIKGETGRAWSAGYQPTRVEADSYQVALSEDKVEITRRDGTIATTLTVVVSEEDDAEVRRVSLTNLGDRAAGKSRSRRTPNWSWHPPGPTPPTPRSPTSSCRPKRWPATTPCSPPAGPVRSKKRRIWAGHVLAVTGEAVGGVQFETDRARFLGRGNQIHRAAAVDRPLSNSVGRVLDPVFSLRRKVRIQPGATAHLDFTTVVARTRAEALDLIDKFSDPAAFERSLTLAWTQAQVRLHHLRIDPEQAHVFQQLAGKLIYSDPAQRTPLSSERCRLRQPRPRCGSTASPGTCRSCLVRIDQPEERGLVRDLLRAQEYWRMKGLLADLVIINEKPGSYVEELQAAIEELIREAGHGVGQAVDGKGLRPQRPHAHRRRPQHPAIGGAGRAAQPPRDPRRPAGPPASGRRWPRCSDRGRGRHRTR